MPTYTHAHVHACRGQSKTSDIFLLTLHSTSSKQDLLDPNCLWLGCWPGNPQICPPFPPVWGDRQVKLGLAFHVGAGHVNLGPCAFRVSKCSYPLWHLPSPSNMFLTRARCHSTLAFNVLSNLSLHHTPSKVL